MAKGFVGGFVGAIIGIVLAVIILIILVYIFAPNIAPSTPCLLDANCKPQKLCCTWRCDSTKMEWWDCPDTVCELLDKPTTDPGLSCDCKELQCGILEPSEE